MEDIRSTDSSDVRIDGWLVQPSLNLLSRDEVKVRLRAQLMDLLLCLASRPGKVFGKDEILAAVWENRWVAPSSLSRCIAELRSALGDDAQNPRVIETITKRGYRLIAPVGPADNRCPAEPGGMLDAAPGWTAGQVCPQPEPTGVPHTFRRLFERAARRLGPRLSAGA